MSHKPDGSLKHKLSDAVKPDTSNPIPTHSRQGRPNDAKEPRDAAVKLANARTNSGIGSNKDHMVDIGRGEETSGRRGQ
jgi:hypothetical protein